MDENSKRNKSVTTGQPLPEVLPELAFVMAPRQNLFFIELVEALRAEATALGARTSLHLGNFPEPRPDLVYVLVPPHEYFTLLQGRIGPPPEALRRTIYVCGEQPGTPFFEHNLSLAHRGGAVFDINRNAVRAFARAGVEAHHLQLGWTSGWDHLRERERDIDVLFMGCHSDRRAHALSEYARSSWRRRVQFVISDNSRPNWEASESFRVDEQKWDLLGRSKILINLHQDSTPYFEWLRVVQAMINGAVVVSEHSADFEPLQPGKHFLAGTPESLFLLAEMLLQDGHRWWRMQTDAYEFLRHELALRSSVEHLLSISCKVATNPMPESSNAFFTQPAPDPECIGIFQKATIVPSPARGDHNAAILRRAVKDIRIELLELRRASIRDELRQADGRTPPLVEVVDKTRAYAGIKPRVSILTTLYNYEQHIPKALDSVLRSHEHSWEIIVVDDGSSDGSLGVVRTWMVDHQDVGVLLLRHPVNRGLAHARNSALGWARGDYCFVLDADNEIYPHCLGRLIGVLDADLDATFSYGMLERFRLGESVGLMNIYPWQPQRLRTGNYIDAMAMIRTDALRETFGGYTLDRRLYGWEDFELWCRMAEAGCRAILVPEVVARYRVAQHSMLSLTNISASDAFSIIIENNPQLMAGMVPPE